LLALLFLAGMICGILPGVAAIIIKQQNRLLALTDTIGGATIILVTEPENFEFARKAHVQPVSTMADALDMTYRRCGSDKPTIAVMPKGANTFPILV
jgi:hypothetical protein